MQALALVPHILVPVSMFRQEKRYQETRKRLEPWKDKVRWPAGPASTPAVLSRRLLP